MPYINVKVDLDEVYDQMGTYDKHDMAEWLYKDKILETHPNSEIRKTFRNS